MLIVSVVLVVAGLRGRVAGDDPHCRRCGFNLRGRNLSSSKCSECGNELTDSAVRHGVRERRGAVLGVGIVLMTLSLAGLGLAGYAWASGYDWIKWKPLAWLLEDVEKTSGAYYAAA